MPVGKSSSGFTKSAQAAKFVRNRDLKLKSGEQKKEDQIARAMCEGVCRRCREKAQWRFKYDKYKPLKKPGSCQNCRQKTVTKAYRSLCDTCGAKKKVCSACCISLAEAAAADAQLEGVLDSILESKNKDEQLGSDDEDDEDDEEEEQEEEQQQQENEEEEEEEEDFGCVIESTAAESLSELTALKQGDVVASSSSSSGAGGIEKNSRDEDAEEDDEESVYEDCSDSEGVEEDEVQGEGDNEDDEEEEDDEEGGDVLGEEITETVFNKPIRKTTTFSTSSNGLSVSGGDDNRSVASEAVSINAEIKLMDVIWDERKFTNLAASKYSKSRVVGKEDPKY